MKQSRYRYLFGLVPSRRFGRSLGVDLTPFKTCSFDCVFCQLGRTTQRTTVRRDYVPVDAVIAELTDWLATDGSADYITLAGSGEPTLHRDFGRVIEFVRGASQIPLALLTNGSLLSDPEVRDQAARAAVVKVSLSAWNAALFADINRPEPGLDFMRMVQGQRRFREQFTGKLWMEVFLAWGINTDPDDLCRIAALAASIAPDRIQLNTAVRPPCEAYARAVPGAEMQAFTALFDPPAEVIAEYSSAAVGNAPGTDSDVLEMLKRRPCTLDEISRMFSLHRNEASKFVGRLMRTGQVVEQRRGGAAYYLGSPGVEPVVSREAETGCEPPPDGGVRAP